MERSTRWLLLGDLVVIVIFSAMGRAAHELSLGLRGVLTTALPFGIAWFGIGWLTRAFRPSAYRTPSAAAQRAALTALFAVPLAIVLRALWLMRPIPWTFLAVALVTNLILFTLWRAAFAWLQGRQTPGPGR